MENIPVPFVRNSPVTIFHVDVNSAFLSWSAAYRVHILGEQTDLRRIPSIVGGDQSKRHGIVLAKSTPAKRYGIQTGEAIVTAREKCPNLVVVSPDYDLYVKASDAFIQKLKACSDNVIQYSIDEAWAVFEGYETLYGRGQMVRFAHQLKDEIREELGFTVNIGVSDNFLLSKMAGDFSKPDKVHTLFPEEIPVKMWPLPVSDLFFVGKATAARLHRLGIYTIGELACADEDMIRAHLHLCGSIVQGYARGKDLSECMFTHAPNKGYGNSMTAPVDVTDAEYARHLLLSLCETVGSRIRADHAQISAVSVHITSCEFVRESTQMQLMTATNVTEEIYRAACQLFDRLWDRKTPIRQIGVHTARVSHDSGRQYNMFDMDKFDRLEVLNHTVDEIRARYGKEAVMRASFAGEDEYVRQILRR